MPRPCHFPKVSFSGERRLQGAMRRYLTAFRNHSLMCRSTVEKCRERYGDDPTSRSGITAGGQSRVPRPAALHYGSEGSRAMVGGKHLCTDDARPDAFGGGLS